MSCEVSVQGLSQSQCNALEAGKALIAERKQVIDNSRSRFYRESNERNVDPGFSRVVTDLSNDKGIRKAPRTPSQQEVMSLGTAFLDMKNLANAAAITLNSALASQSDPVRSFNSQELLRVDPLGQRISSPYDVLAKAAKEALSTNPENKLLAKFVEAHEKFSAHRNRMNSEFYPNPL